MPRSPDGLDTAHDDAFLEAIARAMPAAMWTVDAELVVRSALGLPKVRGETLIVLGRTLYDIFETSDVTSPAIAAHRRALAGEIVAFDGIFAGRYYHAFLQPRVQAGRDGVLGFAVDATSERQMLRSLRESEEALAWAQSAAHLGSWTHDLRSDAVTWSSELFALCGLERDAIRPTPGLLERFVHPDDRIALAAAIDYAREERCPFVIDTRLSGMRGEQRWVQHRGKFSYDGPRAMRAIGTVLDITARKRAEEHLAYQANYDDLTGLPNRKRLAERLRDSILNAQQGDALLAVLYVDLDRFKTINDTLGHDAGDLFLRSVAPRLLGAVGENDIVARTGGDEFVIVLPEVASVGEAGRIAERVVAAFARPISVDGRDLYSSASIGISIFPGDGETADELVRAADAALYRAKSVGQGTFRFYAATTHVGALDRLDLDQRIRSAFGRQEFVVYFQPIVDRFERPVAVEALVRWEDPELGTIMPDRFIPMCEETGFIVVLGRWVVRRALEHVAAWDARGMPPLRLAVNVSGRQLVDPSLTDTLRAAITDFGVAPDRLELEVTESVVVADVVGARRILRDLKTLGVRISLDDFGTGYSALSYLKHFDVDALKIDRTFVRDLPFDRGDSAIVSAVIALGHAMDLSIVAEGVETAEQAALVRRLGCDEMQGYYFARPQPADDVERVLRAWSGVGPPQ